MKKISDETYVNHQPAETLRPGNRSVTPPIYQSVKFASETCEEGRKVWAEREGRYTYSRVANPTVRQLETLLCHLQKREDALALSSGVAALSACLLALLKPDDHVVIFLESYKPTRYLVQNLMGRFGVKSSLVSITNREAWEAAFIPGKTKLVMFESPTNPMTRIADVAAITGVAKQCGALTLMDNTFAGFHHHGEYPIDIFVHSLTKFANGHGDAMGGVIIASKEIIGKIRFDAIELGAVLDPHAAFLILRGMKTYFLRYERQSENALKVAQFLEGHPKVEKVYYPGLPSHPEFTLNQNQMRGSGSIIAFHLKGDARAADAFMDSLKIFIMTGSLGSTESLVAPAKQFYATDFNDAQLGIVDIRPSTLRLSVGIESAADLIEDLNRALEAVPG